MPLSPDDLQSRIDALLRADDFGLARWTPAFEDAPLVLTYQFETSYPDDFPWDNVSAPEPFPNAEKNAIRDAIGEYERYLNVTFQEVTGDADADMSFYNAADLFTDSSIVAGGRGRFDFSWSFANGPSFIWDGHVSFRSDIDLSSPEAYALILHEMGHMMGLKHPGDYDVDEDARPVGPFLPADEDNDRLTLMSYNENEDGNGAPQFLRLYDVAALQDWWGVNPDTGAGRDVYRPFDEDLLTTIWDTGGTDKIRHTGTDPLRVDLREGAFSSVDGREAAVIAYGSEIEQAQGAKGADHITGNDLANTLTGAAGRDTLKGGSGADTLLGGNGADRIWGDAGSDRIDGGKGNDRLTGGGSADVFVFGPKSGKDRITDFTDDRDTLKLDTDLWEGTLTKQQVLDRFATVTEVGLFLTFDAARVRLDGFDDIAALKDDLSLA